MNVLLRGQSNALLFADFGGAGAMEQQLEQKLGGGVDIHLIYQWGDGGGQNTINSGSAFMAWDTDGKQAGFMSYLNGLPEDLQDNPTITLWMHNEDEMKNNPATADWVGEVRTDAAMVRDALGQGASTTPYLFTWVPYNYGQGTANVQAGMRELAADASFNADLALNAMDGIAMDGDGYANSSHMGRADAQVVAGRLADALAPIASELADGGGGGGGGSSTPTTPPPPPTPFETTAGSGPDSLVLKISQDAYQGSAQYTVSVDGKQVGGTLTASASHAAGESDTLTVKGDWGPGDHKVEVKFLNDAWGGSAATDRNLHVDGAAYNGQAVAGAAQAIATDTAAGAFSFAEALEPEQPVSYPPATLAAGEGPDALVLKISQDVHEGSAQYQVFVDGEQVGETFTASASHAAGQSDTLTLKGDWGPGEHEVELAFLNDAWDGTAATDRNLYVDAAAYNGQAVQGAAQAIENDRAPGAFSFTEAAATPAVMIPPPVVAGTGADSLVLKISQDAYQGPAEYTVSVDGVQVGGTFTASSLHGSGVSDTLTLKGDWAAGEHEVEVRFLNDAWDGTAATDRNLYVDAATYNGQAVDGAAQAIESDRAPGAFSFTEAAAPAPVAETGTDGADLFDATAAGGLFTGKGGRDLYVFEAGDGAVTVADFASRQDKLVFVGFDREDVTTEAATAGPPGLLVHYGDAGTVFLAGVTALAERDMMFA